MVYDIKPKSLVDIVKFEKGSRIGRKHIREAWNRCGFDPFWERYYFPWNTPNWDNLTGFEFNGYNLSPMARMFGIGQFRKAFFDAGGRKLGYNLFMQQNGVENEWVPKEGANPRGFFEVEFDEGMHPHAMRINYSKGKMGLFHDPLMDYVLQHPENPDLLVGLAYWSVFGLDLGRAGFFILEKAGEIPKERMDDVETLNIVNKYV